MLPRFRLQSPTRPGGCMVLLAVLFDLTVTPACLWWNHTRMPIETWRNQQPPPGSTLQIWHGASPPNSQLPKNNPSFSFKKPSSPSFCHGLNHVLPWKKLLRNPSHGDTSGDHDVISEDIRRMMARVKISALYDAIPRIGSQDTETRALCHVNR
jgi:hypothetical protein